MSNLNNQAAAFTIPLEVLKDKLSKYDESFLLRTEQDIGIPSLQYKEKSIPFKNLKKNLSILNTNKILCKYSTTVDRITFHNGSHVQNIK